jgi:hypothetical protein
MPPQRRYPCPSEELEVKVAEVAASGEVTTSSESANGEAAAATVPAAGTAQLPSLRSEMGTEDKPPSAGESSLDPAAAGNPADVTAVADGAATVTGAPKVSEGVGRLPHAAATQPDASQPPPESDQGGGSTHKAGLGYRACVTAALSILATGAGLVKFQWLLDNETYAKWGLIGFLLLVIVTLWLAHQWSIDRMAELPTSYPAATVIHDCHYCGGGKAFVVCSHCGSIQWETLRSCKKGSASRWALAVFLAHHRWKLLAAVLSVVVVGTIAFAAQLQVHLWQRRADAQVAREMQAREVINAMTSVRSALLGLAAFCGTKTKDEFKKDCLDRFTVVVDQYHRLSWHAPPLLSYLMKSRCSAGSSNKACSLLEGLEQQETAKTGLGPLWAGLMKANKCSAGSSNKACALWEELEKQEMAKTDLVDCMDDSFRAVVREFTTRNTPEKRRDSVVDFYQHGRRLSCVLNWLSFGPEPGDPGYDMFTSCNDVLLIDATANKPSCEKPELPSEPSFGLWSTWFGLPPPQTKTAPV